MASFLSKFVWYIPEPDEALRSVDTVAVGTLRKDESNWAIVLTEVLKGDYYAGQVIPMTAEHRGGILSMPVWSTCAKTRDNNTCITIAASIADNEGTTNNQPARCEINPTKSHST